MPSRRQLLATCAVGLVGTIAGCVHPDAVLSMEPVETDAEVAIEATLDSGPDQYRDNTDLLDDVADDGVAEVAAEDPPYDLAQPVRHEGAVYDLSWTVVDEGTRTEYRIELQYDPEADREPDVTLGELPAPDRAAVEEMRAVLTRSEPPEGESREESVGTAVDRHYDEAEREASVLVPEPEHDVVAVDGHAVAVRSVESVEKTVSTYRYEGEQLAESLAAYGAQLRETEQFQLGELDDEEQEVVSEAIASTYYADGSDDAFDRVAERIVERDPIHVERRRGEWLVRYDGGSYWTELDAVSREDLYEEFAE